MNTLTEFKKQQSKEIEKILGYKDYDEVLHINNMSVGG